MSNSVYPAAIDNPTNPAGSDFQDTVPHHLQHGLENDAIVALETKVGVDGSAVTTTIDYKLSGIPSGGKAASLTGTENLSGKTLVSPTLQGTVTGWIEAGETWTYTSFDSTNATGVITVPTDATTKYQVGMRVEVTQSGTARRGIITNVASTTLTVYFGNLYTLANAAISSPRYSSAKAPYGFNPDPANWSVTLIDSTTRSQSSPTASTWYNLGGLSISIPIGAWNVSYQATIEQNGSSGSVVVVRSTLSTSNNSESTINFTTYHQAFNITNVVAFVHRQNYLTLSTATVYYFNTYTNQSGVTTISNENTVSPLIIRAVSAYL